MRKLLLTFTFLSAIAVVFSQCTPQNFSGPGFLLPDTNQELSLVNPLYYYYQVITTYVPVTASVNGVTIPIDSAKYENVTGLPVGLSIMLNIPPHLSWLSGTNGCFVILGQSPFSAAGTYKPRFSFRIFGLGTSTLLNFEYTMIVVDSLIAKISQAKQADGKVFVFPSDNGLIINSAHPINIKFCIFDLQGKTVYCDFLKLSSGENLVSDFPLRAFRGLLFVRIESEGINYTQKVFIR
jgi:hypothetical protein